jgi:hypothetical protein
MSVCCVIPLCTKRVPTSMETQNAPKTSIQAGKNVHLSYGERSRSLSVCRLIPRIRLSRSQNDVRLTRDRQVLKGVGAWRTADPHSHVQAQSVLFPFQALPRLATFRLGTKDSLVGHHLPTSMLENEKIHVFISWYSRPAPRCGSKR